MQTIRLLEERQQPLDVIGLFQKAFGIPLTVCCREEVAAIHVNRAGQPTDGIDDGVDDVGAERHRLPLTERFGSSGLDPTSRITCWPPPEDVVLAARVDADDGPHPMVMRQLAHLRSPDEVENGEFRGSIEYVNLGTARLAQGLKDLSRGGNGGGNDLEYPGRPAGSSIRKRTPCPLG